MTRRALGASLCLAVSTTLVIGAFVGSPAAAVPAPPTNLGPILVTPASGDDLTLFNGKVAAQCPAGTSDGVFAAVGPGSDFLTNGEGYLGLADETTFTDGDLAWFLYASVANLKTATPTSFQTSSRYALTLYCISPTEDGLTYPSAVYTTDIDYTVGADGAGTWAVVTPGAAVGGNEFFSPDVMQSLDREAGAGVDDSGNLGEPGEPQAAAPGSAAAPGGEVSAPGDAAPPAEEVVPAPGAAVSSGSASEPVENGTVIDASQARAEVGADEGRGIGQVVGLVAIALTLVGGGAWLTIRRRRDNARIDALGGRSTGRDGDTLVAAGASTSTASPPDDGRPDRGGPASQGDR